MAFEVNNKDRMADDKTKLLAKTLNDNANWVRQICMMLHSFQNSPSWCLEPFMSEVDIPFRPNISFMCREEFKNRNKGIIKCDFAANKDDLVSLVLKADKVDVIDEDRSGVVSGFLMKLATDPSVLRRILENYYNLTRAATIIAQRNRDGLDVISIYNTMSLIESAYLDIFGESIIPDEETVGKLVELYERASAIGRRILDYTMSKASSTADVDDTLRYSDYVKTEGDSSLYFDVSVSSSKARLWTLAFNNEADVMRLSFDADAKEQRVDTIVELKCFECLDEAILSADYISKLADGIDEINRVLAETIYQHIPPRRYGTTHKARRLTEHEAELLIDEAWNLLDGLLNAFEEQEDAETKYVPRWSDLIRAHKSDRWFFLDGEGDICIGLTRNNTVTDVEVSFSACVSEDDELLRVDVKRKGDIGLSFGFNIIKTETGVRTDYRFLHNENVLTWLTEDDANDVRKTLSLVTDERSLLEAFKKLRSVAERIMSRAVR